MITIIDNLMHTLALKVAGFNEVVDIYLSQRNVSRDRVVDPYLQSIRAAIIVGSESS